MACSDFVIGFEPIDLGFERDPFPCGREVKKREVNLLRRLGDDETTVNQREYSRGNQQHTDAVDNQFSVISNYQSIERLSAEGVNVTAFLAPAHDQRIEHAFPTQRQTIQEEKVVADD